MGMSFYFIRHGKTLFNTQRKVQGWCDSPLVEEGVTASRAIGSKLAKIEFVSAYASDKERTCQTLAELLDARAIERGERVNSLSAERTLKMSGAVGSDQPRDTGPADATGPAARSAFGSLEPFSPASPSTDGAAIWLEALRESFSSESALTIAGLPLRTDWRLREWCYGDLEMGPGEMLHQRLAEGFGEELPFAEENKRLPETADNLARLDKSGRAERFADIEKRVRSFLTEVGDATLATGGGNVLATTHAFTIRTLMYLIDPKRINDPLYIENGSLTRIDYDGEHFVLRETGALEPQE